MALSRGGPSRSGPTCEGVVLMLIFGLVDVRASTSPKCRGDEVKPSEPPLAQRAGIG